MHVLVIGLGSIGKRHAANIQQLGHTIYIVSSKDKMPEAFGEVVHFQSPGQALLAQQYDAAIICTPTTNHDTALISLLQRKVPLIYVEKPLSHSLENTGEIRRLANSYNNKLVVGFDLHFDPGMVYLKEQLAAHVIGKVVSVNAFVGQHLAQWRPYEDYRNGMSAKVATGGGVLLDLIHEFEYLYRLFGRVTRIAANITNTGTLQIETEESADVLLSFESGVSAVVHLDYLQPVLKRYCIITGTKGTITWNLADKTVDVVSNGAAPVIFSYKDFDRNDRFVDAMRSFLSNKHDERFATLDDGIASLDIVLRAKAAAGYTVAKSDKNVQVSDTTAAQ